MAITVKAIKNMGKRRNKENKVMEPQSTITAGISLLPMIKVAIPRATQNKSVASK
jgi:hypothetical protein